MYIIIAGCGKIGSNLALSLSQENHDVVVIDNDPKKFEQLGSGFNGVVIAGIPIDEDVLRGAGIEQADAVAAVTNDDNMNFMISQIADELFGVPTVITRLYDPERDRVFDKMGLTTICPTMLAVDKLKDMLIPQNEHATVNLGGVNISFRLVKPPRQFIGRSTATLSSRNIFGVIRNGSFLFANADPIIQPGDMLIISEYIGWDGDAECI
ncbi:potassium channel family protein [Mahella australiensis]|uniref:TrkA-N domain protein n=1 Tax=Mahella australiensis (strain DSM 15567 / CIP 107919 / 50-1 BON) TaxID=697281 RepID=F4A0D2_MAHA5|nr:TrkA family potassium uptake protein [Mahella australiensis]AEE97993.1 TrkA-N domain protein [Mahella australiensis 50-1 BON]